MVSYHHFPAEISYKQEGNWSPLSPPAWLAVMGSVPAGLALDFCALAAYSWETRKILQPPVFTFISKVPSESSFLPIQSVLAERIDIHPVCRLFPGSLTRECEVTL